jgi:cell division protein FtsI (penicillin-binding protein 3)
MSTSRIQGLGSRAYIVFICFAVVAIAIMGKVFMLQMFPDPEASKLALNYTERIRDINPSRGHIYSIDGNLLATSVAEYDLRWDAKASYDVDFYRSRIDSFCIKMSQLFGDRTASQYVALFVEARKSGNRYMLIKDKIDHDQLKALKEFPFIRQGVAKSGFVVVNKEVRDRPQGPVAWRTIGSAGTTDGDTTRNGLELAYNHWLSGKKGKQLMEKIPGGLWKPMENDFIVKPEAGCDVVSTINSHLQDVAHTALMKQCQLSNATWGTVVLMEVETGYVRAIANLKRTGEGIYEDIENFAVTHRVEPGSTFKLATLMACMEEGAITLEDSVNTGNGRIEFYGIEMTDSNADKGGHGTITVEQVFEMSSNVGTALVVKKAFQNNPQKFLDRLHKFGLSKPLDIELQGEVSPRIYADTKAKGWSGVSLTQMAIGYELLQTPLQMLSFYNAIANDGKMMRPRFAQEVKKDNNVIETFEPEVIHEDFCSKKTLAMAKKMMEGVMEKGGTAEHVFEKSSYKAAGKTGTAWLNEGGGYQHRRYRASFVGYFPADEPKYSCIVIVNNPEGAYYGSSVAAPVFKELSDRICSTELEFHQPVQQSDTLLVESKMVPASKNGSFSQLKTVFKGLNIPIEGSSSSEWANTVSSEEKVNVSTIKVDQGKVPNVKGMGLRDALHLLENQGMKVQVFGVGKVVSQSVLPGASVNQNKYITIHLS